IGSGSISTSNAWASAVLPRETGRETRIMCRAGRALRWRGAAEEGLLARPDSPSRCTLPITAFRVTFPSSAAIWLADNPASQSFFSCSTRSSDQVNTVIAFFPSRHAGQSGQRWRRHSSQKSLRSESLSPRRARKPRPNVYAAQKWTLGIRTAARDVVPDSPDATIWRDSGARVRARASTCSDIYALQLEFSTAPESYGLLYLALQERRI